MSTLPFTDLIASTFPQQRSKESKRMQAREAITVLSRPTYQVM
jgi:hypothetical protein